MSETTPINLIDHWSYSSMSQLMRNPLAFKKKYILKIYDDTSSPSGVVGSAGHKALEAYYNGKDFDAAKMVGLEYINNMSDMGINYGKTGTREQIINSFNQAINFYFEELPTYHKILGVEKGITAKCETIDGEPLPLPLKSFSDLIIENELGEIWIVDHKFVKSYSDGDVDNFSHFLQGMFNYHTIKKEYGRAPTGIIFNECKVSRNKNGEPQIQPYTITFDGQYGDFATFYKLLNACTKLINLPEMVFLPNPADIFDGQNSFDAFRMGVIGTDRPITVQHKTEQIQFAEKQYVPTATDNVANENLTDEEKIRLKLMEFGVTVKMEKTKIGASIIRYSMKPSRGIPMSKIARYADDLSLALEAHSLRLETPIRGTSLVGVEVPNPNRTRIDFGANHLRPNTMNIPIGVDVNGDVLHYDLAQMPHLLIAGQTGAGKSVMLNVILSSLTEQMNKSKLKLVLIDPKQVELAMFDGDPHLQMPIITDIETAMHTLDDMVKIMEKRYTKLRKAGFRNIDDFVAAGNRMSKIVIVIDEFADLIMSDIKPSVETMDIARFNENLMWILSESKTGKLTQKATREAIKRTIAETAPPSAQDSIIRIAQKARAVGMHIILATQRPSADVVTGLIKANIPTKIAFTVTSKVNSQIILDANGAEQLTGKGDMLFTAPDTPITRLQGLYK